MKKAFITGVTGQDGAYLSKLLQKKGYKIFGLAKKGASSSNLDDLGIKKKVDLFYGDIRDRATLKRLIDKTKPQEVYNFAAHSFVGDSWKDVKKINEINYFGVINLLDILRQSRKNARFYQASTSEMFGESGARGLQTENTPFRPLSPYAISKLAAYHLVNNYRRSYNMFCCNGICFNHESPLRAPHFVTRKISLGVAKIKLGLQNKIELGNLDSIRDWGFAGDYVKAMWLMLQQDKPGNYIISTGKNHTVKDILDTAFDTVGISDWKNHVAINKKHNRPVELKRLAGSNRKAKKILKWEPKLKFEDLIRSMVKADLKRIKDGQKI